MNAHTNSHSRMHTHAPAAPRHSNYKATQGNNSGGRERELVKMSEGSKVKEKKRE